MIERITRFRFFGHLPDPPKDTWIIGPGKMDERLRTSVEENPRDIGLRITWANFAMLFRRVDLLGDTEKTLRESDDSRAALAAARILFYRSLVAIDRKEAEALRVEAETLFQTVAGNGLSTDTAEAKAGIARIRTTEGDFRAAMRILRLLARDRRPEMRFAAAGGRYFLAEWKAISPRAARRHLRASRLLVSGIPSGGAIGESAALAFFDLAEGTDGADIALARIRTLKEEGCREAVLETATLDAVEDGGIALRKYREQYPGDPRPLLLEGDIAAAQNVVSARNAWIAAVALDERQVWAWFRLGNLYRDILESNADDGTEELLFAARDAYRRAAQLDPLNPLHPMGWGMAERDLENFETAAALLERSLLLDPGNADILRWSGATWSDIAGNENLGEEKRLAAAQKSRLAWREARAADPGNPGDVEGEIHAMALEWAIGDGENGEIRSELRTLVRNSPNIYLQLDPENQASLAEDLYRIGEIETAKKLLETALEASPELPSALHKMGAIEEGREDTPENQESAFRWYDRARLECPPDDPAYLRYCFDAARLAGATGRGKEVFEIWDRAYSHYKGDRDVLHHLVGALERLGRRGEAKNRYLEALAVSPGEPRLREDAAWALRRLGFREESESVLRGGVKRFPEDAELWNQLGIHFLDLGPDDFPGDGNDHEANKAILDDAIAAYRRAMELDPGNTVYRGNLGDALRQAGRWAESRALLEEALQGGENDAFSLNAFGRLEDDLAYQMEGTDSGYDSWEAAGEHYRKAALSESENSGYQKDYAWWLYRERRHDESIRFYFRGFVADPTDATLPYGEAMCHRELGDEKSALAAILRARSVDPGNLEYAIEEADIRGDLGDAETGEALYREILSAGRGEAWIYSRLAIFREARAEELSMAEEAAPWRRGAVTAWMRAVGADPENVLYLARLGESWRIVGRRDKARARLEEALTLSPDDPYVVNRLGRLEESEVRRREKAGEADEASRRGR